jgi:hypothetical protein
VTGAEGLLAGGQDASVLVDGGLGVAAGQASAGQAQRGGQGRGTVRAVQPLVSGQRLLGEPRSGSGVSSCQERGGVLSSKSASALGSPGPCACWLRPAASCRTVSASLLSPQAASARPRLTLAAIAAGWTGPSTRSRWSMTHRFPDPRKLPYTPSAAATHPVAQASRG